MISDFLKRQKRNLQDRENDMKKELDSIRIEIEETQKFILILDEGRDKLLHTVSPYSSDDADERKMQELRRKQHELEEKYQSLSEELDSLSKLLSEYDECIDDAFDLEYRGGKLNSSSAKDLFPDQNKDFYLQLLTEQDQEKVNAAKELFDSFSPLFTIATYRLDIAQKFMDFDPERSRKEILDVSDTVENCISEMDRILSMISPIDYQNKSLKEALEQEFHRMHEASGVKIHFDYQGDKEPSSKVVCSSVYQMIQEICFCMVEYDRPAEIHVDIRCDDRENHRLVRIKLYDHGLTEGSSTSKDSFTENWYQDKLCLVKEKIFLLSGTMDIKSSVSGETHITIKVPFEE